MLEEKKGRRSKSGDEVLWRPDIRDVFYCRGSCFG